MTEIETVDREHFFQLSSCKYSLMGRSMKLSVETTSHLDVRKFFFGQRVVKKWKQLLPQEVVDATSRDGHET